MRNILTLSVAATVLIGCVTLPSNAFLVTPEQLARRDIETRRYKGIKEENLLIAASNVLQDMGFSLENSETKLGLISASKERDATEAGEVVVAILIAVFGGGATPISKDQTIRVSLVVRPELATADNNPVDSHFVRVTFQRIVRRTDNSTFAQTLSENELYEGFFEKLSKSVFLEAQKI